MRALEFGLMLRCSAKHLEKKEQNQADQIFVFIFVRVEMLIVTDESNFSPPIVPDQTLGVYVHPSIPSITPSAF